MPWGGWGCSYAMVWPSLGPFSSDRPYHLFFLRKEGESGSCGKDRVLGTPTNRVRTGKHRPGKESASQ